MRNELQLPQSHRTTTPTTATKSMGIKWQRPNTPIREGMVEPRWEGELRESIWDTFAYPQLDWLIAILSQQEGMISDGRYGPQFKSRSHRRSGLKAHGMMGVYSQQVHKHCNDKVEADDDTEVHREEQHILTTQEKPSGTPTQHTIYFSGTFTLPGKTLRTTTTKKHKTNKNKTKKQR